MSYQAEDHYARNIMIATVIILVVVGIAVFSMNRSIDQNLQEMRERWQAEHDRVETMSCSELKDGMLYNQIKASDNKQRATERFLGMGCEQ